MYDRWITVHMGGQIAIKIAWILNPDKFNRIVAGPHIYRITGLQLNWGMPINADDSLMFCVNRDFYGGSLRQDDSPINGKMRGHRNQKDVP